MNITIKINTDNAAFVENFFDEEIKNIMMEATAIIIDTRTNESNRSVLMDSNGNRVGEVLVTHTKNDNAGWGSISALRKH
jgi:hypothetical protein